ncbi:alpha/beta hydrolase-fold protein [Oceanirhabdus sp. W0125-5]|uniref:alpha/beta hydrolase-fold protein n=1 Tax=Oceanirhabdus sp. W0125-5 TaxID=2999116 RepID=UPI0022F2CABF|nr:alpha/beta hydrolase-fold protein [Oceanirhabdus sp. W0125-5]WBW97787.1 alpha/beta hydrolase-fold protein [Oceanirhabdus sp. W0125-5]
MATIQCSSKIIENLKFNLDSGNHEFLNSFWSNIKETGTPIIEPIDGNTEYSLATFLYRGDETTQTISVCIPPKTAPESSEDKPLSELKLNRLSNTNVWYTSCVVRNNIRFAYRFLLNCSLDKVHEHPDSWVTDSFSNNNQIFPSSNKAKKDLIIDHVVMNNAAEHIWTKERPDTLKGTLQTYSSRSDILNNERDIRIYIPANYNKDNEPYNLLVLTDGAAYITMSTKEVLDNIINDNKIPPTIAVLINSNSNRMKELSCNDEFCSYVVEEVLPWVRENYNVTSDPAKTVIAGSSLGGLTASFLGFKFPDIFGNILSQSGSYWYKSEDVNDLEKRNWMARQFEKEDKLPLNFYLNVGVLESAMMNDMNREFTDVLLSKGYPVFFEEFKSGHDYLSWGETLGTGLIKLIGTDKKS